MTNEADNVAAYQALIDYLKAELAALRPWAALGKRALREGWWNGYYPGEWKRTAFCCDGEPPEPGEEEGWIHDSDCPVPARLAQLEAPDA